MEEDRVYPLHSASAFADVPGVGVAPNKQKKQNLYKFALLATFVSRARDALLAYLQIKNLHT